MSNHKGVWNREFSFKNARRLDSQTSKLIKEVIERYSMCQKTTSSKYRPSMAIPRAKGFNSIVTLDLKEIGKKYIHIVDGECIFKDDCRSSVER